MKATGMVRRIDDLGRIIIPKELRRTMNIREGDPFEYYVDKSTGSIIIKKYMPLGEKDWHKAKKILVHILNAPFAIYDSFEKQVENSGRFPNIPLEECRGRYNISNLVHDGDTVGWLVTEQGAPNVMMARCVVTELFNENN